ncbi:MAG: glycosyltransferase, partial [Dehalococcoidia bacterium]|nr:glycosyltransferase [Dehalococcoidia bacterium]
MAGEDVTLAAMDLGSRGGGPPFLKLFPIGAGPRAAGRSPQMWRWLLDEAAGGRVDVLHSHGMWQMNAVYPGWAAKRRGVKLVVSPRGAFSRWAMSHGSWTKQVFWPLLQRPALERACCLHAASDAEYEDIRRLGFRQPVAVIPNGVDVPLTARPRASSQRTLLYLGRIHPTKGIDTLLAAWAEVMSRFPDWRLAIVGTDTVYGARGGYQEELKAFAAARRLARVSFDPPMYGE